MRVSLRSWVLMLGVIVSACAEEPATSEKQLSGVVRDRLSGRRISGARVTFTSDTLYSETTRTDGDGHYEMIVETDTPLGQVHAEHDRYQATEVTVFFDAPERTIDITLLPLVTNDE
jgi:hypothetical protein